MCFESATAEAFTYMLVFKVLFFSFMNFLQFRCHTVLRVTTIFYSIKINVHTLGYNSGSVRRRISDIFHKK